MTKVKICGLTNTEDALAAAEMGADALGFVFAASPRQITQQKARDIIERLPPFVTKVGVFSGGNLSPQEIKDVLEYCGLHLAQLHDDIEPALCRALFPRCVRAIQVKDEKTVDELPLYQASAYLLDGSSGGKGMTFSWDIARAAKRHGLIILAGGLTPENVGKAVETVKPYAVDVSSGVESSPGKKDYQKVKLFIENAKAAAA